MNMTNPSLAIVRLVLAAVLALAGTSAFAQGIDPRVDDRAIVHVRTDAELDAFIVAFEANHADVTLTAIDSLPARRMYLLEVGLPPDYTEQFLEELADDLEGNYFQYLVSGEFLYLNQAPEGKTGSLWTAGVSEDQFQMQYGVELTGLGSAHSRSAGLGTVIAFLDTGVDDAHPELAGRVLSNGYDFIDDDADPADVGDNADNDDDGLVDEMTGHGTFVAGLLRLVAPDARLLPVRVLDSDGGGDGWLLTKGLAYAMDQGVEVVNLSLGSTYNVATVEWLIEEEAQALGIVVVAAAGNFNRSEPEEYPAMREGLGVAATDHNDIKADFSNYSRRLFISAPGDIASGPFDPELAIVSILPDGEYAAWEGTSFATPFVAGAAALVRAQHPEWEADLTTYVLIESTLASTAVDIYPLNPEYAENEELGAGRLDAGAAVGLGPVAPETLGDLNNDGFVNTDDLLALLADWGLTHSSADLNGDGSVSTADLLIMLANWT
jgi:thermitase